MNLPTAVGAPITRTLQGTTHQFPRLNLRDYGGLLQSWIDKDLAQLTSDLAEDNATPEESADTLRRFKRTSKTPGYIFDKLNDLHDGSMIIELSLKKTNQNITPDQLNMGADELIELAFELWSRRYLACYRHYLTLLPQEAASSPKP